MSQNLPSVCILFLLTTVVRAAAAEPSLTLDLQAAWDGLMRPGAASEISVRMLAGQGGQVELTLPDQQPPVRTTALLEANLPYTLWIPVHPPENGIVTVEARLDQGAAVRLETRLRPRTPQTLVAALLRTDAETPAERSEQSRTITLLRPAATSLPRTRAAYEVIDALVLDQDALAALDTAQRDSLRTWLQNCGRLIAVGTWSQWFATLEAEAGCGGRFIDRVDRAAQAYAKLAMTVRDLPSALPAETTLRAMLKQIHSSDPWLPLAGFFLLYLLALILLARDIRRPALLLLAPLSATLLSLLVWFNGTAGHRLSSWSEMESGDTTARFSALLHIDGNGRGTSTTTLPADLGLPTLLTANPAAEARYNRQPPMAVQIEVDNHLLSRHEFLLYGTSAVQYSLTLALSTDGPLLTNTGSVPTAPGLLGWQGSRYPVPSLQPGQHWSPPEQDTLWNPLSRAEQILRARTGTGTAAVLVPFLPPGIRGIKPQVEESGWLLIHTS
ncbi:MAG: hypothetical protein BMS9Abin08_0298 [Gammaproteobacteria bacterium]|nr:MAG: hypothetical protein BMS9Abin08_0298 [Gammaproteobacteria bacterium]